MLNKRLIGQIDVGDLVDSRFDQRAPEFATAAQGTKADAALPSTARGATNGVASLVGGKVPIGQTPTAEIAASTDLKTAFVGKSGAEIIAGTKTFSSPPVVPDASFMIAKIAELQSKLDERPTLDFFPVMASSFRHGVDPTFTDDSRAGLQAAIDEAWNYVIAPQKAANNDTVNIPITKSVVVPEGCFKILSSLIMRPGVSLKLNPGAVIKAGAAMGVMLDSSPTVLLQRATIEGGLWDCNGFAETAIYLRWQIAMIIRGIRVNDPTKDAIIIGDPNSTQTSYESIITECDIYRPRLTASPVENRLVTVGVAFKDSGDIVTVPAHDSANGDTIVFGAITGTTGIAAGTTYYIKTVLSPDTFTISATLGGATLALTNDGTAVSAALVRGYRGIWMRRVTDSYVSTQVPRGFAVGIRNDGGSNSFFRCHSWNPTGQDGPIICFDDNGSGTHLIDCYADSPKGIGFRFRGSNPYSMTDCTMYLGPSVEDNTAIAIQCDGAPFLSVKGGEIKGVDASHRWKQDIYVTGGGPASLNIKWDPAFDDFGTVVTRAYNYRSKLHALLLTPGSDPAGLQIEGVLSDAVRIYRDGGALIFTVTADGGIRAGNGSGSGPARYGGSGAPSSSLGAVGDFYDRSDTPTVANQRVYVKTGSSTWTGIV